MAQPGHRPTHHPIPDRLRPLIRLRTYSSRSGSGRHHPHPFTRDAGHPSIAQPAGARDRLSGRHSTAADELILNKTIARYERFDLLCIDELGYLELDKRGAELLFQVLADREETASVAIASNESFGGWTKTFTDPRLCAAIVDRLTFNATIIETGTDSYRLARTRAQQDAALA
ncbi:ATP-binding protein [Planotetraspora mira]|uniref:ATP-binding protein n=1 Tax=Planotetraspora mira TaxID=58121 RepID=UPI0023B2BD68|nr:ATP-binding protein [Planotetraspora mira]